MNKHFEDATYYLKRAGEHAKEGVVEELEPVEKRVRDLTGREAEPEPSRFENLRARIAAVERRAEGEAKEALGNARGKLREYRTRDERPA